MYLTTDWDGAFESEQRLVALHPNILVPGHGTAMEGKDLREGLQRLVKEWKEVAVPDHGKWVKEEK